jgi:hypothetical protein
MALEYHWGGGGLGDGVVVWLSDAYALGGYRGGRGRAGAGAPIGEEGHATACGTGHPTGGTCDQH